MASDGPAELTGSQRWTARARNLIPGHSQTMSKGPSQWVQGLAPTYVTRAEGARVWDVDDRCFLDFPAALGPIILGHRHPAVDDAITEQLRSGITFTFPHPLEVEVAERIRGMVPGAERVRFGKTGSDSTSAAIRLARAFTGRDMVVSAGYHGWHDWYIGSTSRNRGVPTAVSALVEDVPLHAVDAVSNLLEARPGQVAAVIIEPVGLQEPNPGVLQAIVDTARAHGAVAIFDEVITGFRLAPGGAQEHYGVQADLACFGKALGNGMPISALAGRAEIMDLLEEVFFSGTHGGEALSLAAARATLDELSQEGAHAHLWRMGELLQQGLSKIVESHGLQEWVTVGGAAPWTLVAVREPDSVNDGLAAKTFLQAELLRRGVLFNGSHFMMLAHRESDISEALEAYDAALSRLAELLPAGVADALDAPPLAPVFRTVS